MRDTGNRRVRTPYSAPRLPHRRTLRWRTLLVLLAVAATIRTLFFQTYAVPSASMRHTLEPGDVIVADKLIYGIRLPFTAARICARREPRPDDIIIFTYNNEPGRTFVKRCIATGGQTVEIRDKQLYVGTRLIGPAPTALPSESGILPAGTDRRDNLEPFTVPAGEYFCMGDNWDNSRDSRYRGTVQFRNVTGKAAFILWSWNGDETVPWCNIRRKIRWDRIGAVLR